MYTIVASHEEKSRNFRTRSYGEAKPAKHKDRRIIMTGEEGAQGSQSVARKKRSGGALSRESTSTS